MTVDFHHHFDHLYHLFRVECKYETYDEHADTIETWVFEAVCGNDVWRVVYFITR